MCSQETRPSARLSAMKTASPILSVAMADGSPLDLPVTWLRDSCRCSQCVHANGQRLIDPARLPAGLEPTDVRVDGDELTVLWMPEGHESHYSLRSLGERPTPSSPTQLWKAGTATLPVATHPAITQDTAALLDWLRCMATMGCALLREVPVNDGEVARVAELFGHVRETNYGRWFDVRSVVDPANLADSALGLAPHTDNPYRDPVPTMQLLHCLQSSAIGGDNMLVDGWCVANDVRAADPDGFELLSTTPITFSYRDAHAELCARAPLIETDPDGTVRAIRFNPRSMQPPSMPNDALIRWYDAYVLFAHLLADPAYQIRFRLDPGDLFVVDNRRVLHGRAAFEPSSGTRHLQGCYADVDGLHSKIVVLSRERSG
jgi:gamma-butyrobetaine dioxygenase